MTAGLDALAVGGGQFGLAVGKLLPGAGLNLAIADAGAAAAFDLPVLTGTPVLRLTCDGGVFTARTPRGDLSAHSVVVATGAFASPHLPGLAAGVGQEVATPWQRSRGSALLGFVGRDAAEVAVHVVARHQELRRAARCAA